jgi:hypothetical protein
MPETKSTRQQGRLREPNRQKSEHPAKLRLVFGFAYPQKY